MLVLPAGGGGVGALGGSSTTAGSTGAASKKKENIYIFISKYKKKKPGTYPQYFFYTAAFNDANVQTFEKKLFYCREKGIRKLPSHRLGKS